MRRSENRVLLIGGPCAMRPIARALQHLGYEPLGAVSTAEARAIFSGWPLDACAYALVDHLLDDGSGVDLLPELSQLAPAPSVALISGVLTSEVAARAFKSHALPMAHPTDIETLGDLLLMLRRMKTAPEAEHSFRSPQATSQLSPSPAREPLVFQPFTLAAGTLRTPMGAYRLRSAESKLLSHLVRRRPSVVSLQELAQAVLGRDDEGSRRCIYSHVANLRLRLGRYAGLIETECRYGYRLALDVFEMRTDRDSGSARH